MKRLAFAVLTLALGCSSSSSSPVTEASKLPDASADASSWTEDDAGAAARDAATKDGDAAPATSDADPGSDAAPGLDAGDAGATVDAGGPDSAAGWFCFIGSLTDVPFCSGEQMLCLPNGTTNVDAGTPPSCPPDPTNGPCSIPGGPCAVFNAFDSGTWIHGTVQH